VACRDPGGGAIRPCRLEERSRTFEPLARLVRACAGVGHDACAFVQLGLDERVVRQFGGPVEGALRLDVGGERRRALPGPDEHLACLPSNLLGVGASRATL
jgi:hypothetical protein